METLTRDQALEKYTRNANMIEVLTREQNDLKKIIFSTVVRTSEHKSPRTTRASATERKALIGKVLKENGGWMVPAAIVASAGWPKGSAIYNMLADMCKDGILNYNKEAHSYSLAVHTTGPTVGGR